MHDPLGATARTAVAGPRAVGERLSFLDLIRAASVLLMFFGHLNDALLAPEHWATPFGRVYQPIRGLTAPLFFFVAGLAFAVSTLRDPAPFLRLGRPLGKRLWRVATLLLLGFLLTLPWYAPGFPLGMARPTWDAFLTIGVLQCIGLSLLLGHLVLLVTRTGGRFVGVAGALALAGVVLAPVLHAWAAGLPMPLRGMFNPGAVAGGFPLVPWSAFFLLGGCAGFCVLRLSARATLLLALALSAGCLGLEALVQASGWDEATVDGIRTGLFLHRLGWVLALLVVSGVAAWLPGPVMRLLQPAGAHALWFYVGHMVLIWGLPWVGGLAYHVGRSLSFWGVAVLAMAMFAAFTALPLARRRWRQVRSARQPAAGEGEPSPQV